VRRTTRAWFVGSTALVAWIAILAAVSACQRSEAPPPQTPVRQRAPVVKNVADPEIFAPLDLVLKQVDLPFVLDENQEVSQTPCVVTFWNPEPRHSGPLAVKGAADLPDEVSRVFRRWLVEELAPAGISEGLINTWKIAPASIVSQRMSEEGLRFVEEPECIDEETGGLLDGGRLIVELYGTRELLFESKTGLPRDTAEVMQEELAAIGYVFESADLLSGRGEASESDEDGEGGGGSKARPPIESWTVRGDDPLFFAFRQVSSATWQSEFDEETCNINLVWDDPSFRQPECPVASNWGFKATRHSRGRARLTIEIGSTERAIDVSPGEPERIIVDDRTIIWVRLNGIEEGTLVKLDSVVLNDAI